MGRVLGLDVGDKRIGVALSDETRLIASPYCVIQSVGWGPDSRKIAKGRSPWKRKACACPGALRCGGPF